MLPKQIGGQILVGDERTLAELAFRTGPEKVQVKDQVVVFEGHDLAKMYVNKALKVVFEIIGLKTDQEPTGEMMKLLVRHVYQLYPHFRVQDVYEAFVQAVAGTFPAKLQHFGQVDMAYFAKVWKAYDKYAYPPVEQAPRLLAALTPAQEYVRVRPQDSESVKAALRDAYAKFCETGNAGHILFPDGQWHLLYGFDMAADVTQEGWAATYELAAKNVAALKNRNTTYRQRISLESTKQNHAKACEQEAYSILVLTAFTAMKEGGIEVAMLENELARVSYIHSEKYLWLWRQTQRS